MSEAAEAARGGQRTLAIITRDELSSALGAVEHAAQARAPLLVHVLPPPTPGPTGPAVQAALALGAIVLAPWKAQDAIDLALAARRASEDCELPVLLVSDVSRGVRATVFTPEEDFVKSFLGNARIGASGGSTPPAAERDQAAERAPFALASALRDLGERTGRSVSPLFRYETADADDIVVAAGRAVPAALALAEARRVEGQSIGVVGLRALRPFFGPEVVKAVARARAVAVLEPHDFALSPCGRLAADLKAAFADALTWAPGFPGVGRIPPIVSAGLTHLPADEPSMVKAAAQALDELAGGDRARRRLMLADG